MNRYKISALVASIALISSVALASSWPVTDITPDPLDLPNTHVGDTSEVEYFTVTNNDATWPLLIFSVKISDSTNFNIASDECTNTIVNPGENCMIGVSFQPSVSGYFEGSVTVISTGSHIVDSAKVHGTGIAPVVTLSSTSLDFGDQTINKSSQPYEVLLTNSGNEALTLDDISTDAPFSVVNDCGGSVAAGGSCSLEIAFTPTEVKEYAGEVVLTDDADDSPQIISLLGSGILPGVPDISFSRLSIDFGAQAINLISQPQSITIKNSGTAPLVISAITVSDNFELDVNECVKTLAEDETCVVSVIFSPTAVAAYSGTLTVNDNAGGSPHAISLAGRGVQDGSVVIDISTQNINFGNVTVNTESAASVVTVRNDGSIASEITAVYIDGSQNHSFSKQDNCQGQTLDAGEECVISAKFLPLEVGRASATLKILYDASSTPDQVTIAGSGTLPGGGGCSLIR